MPHRRRFARKGKNRRFRKKRVYGISRYHPSKRPGGFILSRSLNATFPPFLRTTMTVHGTSSMAGTLAPGTDGSATFHFFKLNSILSVGPSIQADVAAPPGAYAANYPGAIKYLLSSSTNTNPLQILGAPYALFLVIGSRITIKISRIESSTDVQPIQFVLVPQSTDWSTLGMGQTVHNIGEQPYAVNTVIPPEITTKPVVVRSGITMKKLHGLTRDIATNDDDYTGIWNAGPTVLSNWLLAANTNTQTSVAWNLTYEYTIDYDTVFSDRNMFGSGAPV